MRLIRKLLRREHGQVLALAAILATALLGVLGLIIDGGFFYSQRRHVQSAADAASLAATYRLATGGSEADAIATALEYAEDNGYDNDGTSNTVTVNIPPLTGDFAGVDGYIEVIIEEDPSTVFIHVLTDDAETIRGRGVAGYHESSGSTYALFAGSSNCGDPDTLEIGGSDNIVVGEVHANANVKVPGSNNEFNGQVTYRCSIDNGGSGNTYTPPHQQGGLEPFPLNYQYSDFPCTVSFSSDIDISSVGSLWQDSTTLKDNVICSTGTITLSRQGSTGNVTLVSTQEINLNGSDFNLHPLWNNILAYTSSSSSSALDISGSSGAWEGIFLAPNGNAKLQGSSNQTLNGSVMANTIKSVSGSGLTITAMTEATGGPSTVALVE